MAEADTRISNQTGFILGGQQAKSNTSTTRKVEHNQSPRVALFGKTGSHALGERAEETVGCMAMQFSYGGLGIPSTSPARSIADKQGKARPGNKTTSDMII